MSLATKVDLSCISLVGSQNFASVMKEHLIRAEEELDWILVLTLALWNIDCLCVLFYFFAETLKERFQLRNWDAEVHSLI